METKISFGLRHLPTGRFVRMTVESNVGRENCGESTCTLVAIGDSHNARFEVETPYELVAAMRHNPEWYNSSETRPCWGRVRMEDCHPFAFVREYDYDVLGGDPVSVTERAVPMQFPEYFAGTVMNTKQPRHQDLPELFGPAGNMPEDAWPVVNLVKLDGSELREGMMINGGIVVASVPVPARWPVDPGRPFDRKDPDYRIVLARSDFMRQENVLPEEFMAKDDEAMPAPGR